MLSIIICDDDEYCKTYINDPSVENCKNQKTGDGYCCYIETPKSKVKKDCISLSKYKYDNIGDYVKLWKKFGGDDENTEDKDVKIDCKSFYLQFSSIILLLFFLLN